MHLRLPHRIQSIARPIALSLLVLAGSGPLAATARADEVVLLSGERLVGAIVESTDEGVTIEHRLFGRLFVAAEDIESFTVGDPDQVEVTESEPAPEEDEALADAVEEEEKDWTASLDVGLASVTGNTDERVVSIGGYFLRETETSRLNIDLSYYWKESDNSVTDDKLTSGIRHDWLNPGSDWFFFGQGRYDYDQFESWRHRAAGHGGPGYRVFNKDGLTLNLRAGLGARKEWGSDNEDVHPEGLAGLDFTWQMNSRNSLVIDASYFPTLDDFTDEYRTRETVRWRYKLNDHLSLAVGLSHEYQSIVDPGKDRNDTRFTIGLGLDF